MIKSEEVELVLLINTFPLMTLKDLAKEFDTSTTQMGRKLSELGYIKAWYRFSEPIKRCGSCKEDLPIEDFGVANHIIDGKQLYCKKCNCNTSREQREISVPERKLVKKVPTNTDDMSKDEKRVYWSNKYKESQDGK